MEGNGKRSADSQAMQKQFIRTANRIKRARKNNKPEKEAAEFEEIHRILEAKEEDFSPVIEPRVVDEPTDPKKLDLCVIPLDIPSVKIFKEESLFSLFDKDSLKLTNFVNSEEEVLKIFGKDGSIPSEDCFRNLIAYHVADNLTPNGEKQSCVNLYVLYLMSVHDKPAFVAACFDFLVLRPFYLESKHIFPILLNFGATLDKCSCDKALMKKLSGKDDGVGRGDGENKKFPYFNMEMVGKLLAHYVTGNFIKVDSETKYLVKSLAKMTLDRKVKSGLLLPIYSILVSKLSERAMSDFGLREIVDWLHFRDEHLLNQMEICRMVSQAICPKLHDALVFKTIRTILKSKTLPRHSSSMMKFIKLVLRKLKYKELTPLEFYSLFQIINSSLPGITATSEESSEVNKLLAYLETKIIQAEDTVDLIRLKLELAKARNLVINCVSDRFSLEEASLRSSSRRR